MITGSAYPKGHLGGITAGSEDEEERKNAKDKSRVVCQRELLQA